MFMYHPYVHVPSTYSCTIYIFMDIHVLVTIEINKNRTIQIQIELIITTKRYLSCHHVNANES